MGIVLAHQQIGGVLLDVSDVARTFESRPQRRVSGHGRRYGNALVEGTQDDGLPSTAGKTSDAEPRAVHARMLFEKVKAFPHGEVEQTHTVRANQVEMRAEPVTVFNVCQFAIAEPLQV